MFLCDIDIFHGGCTQRLRIFRLGRNEFLLNRNIRIKHFLRYLKSIQIDPALRSQIKIAATINTADFQELILWIDNHNVIIC